MKLTLMLLGLLMLAGGCNNPLTGPVERLAGRMGDILSGNTATVAAQRMQDADFPDERRIGINQLVRRDYGEREPYTTRYAQIARDDSSPLVRATAIRALNRSRDASASGVYIRALGDPSPLVRLEAAKALANMPSEAATTALIGIMRDQAEDDDVRLAAAEALSHYRKLEVARALVAQLQDRRFGLSWQSRRSLRRITGADYQYDEGAWLQYLSSSQSPLT